VTDTLPAGESYVSFVAPAWTCSDVLQIVTCQLAAGVPVSTSASLTLNVHVASNVASSVLVNTARAASPTPDPIPLNDTADDPTQILTSADLSIVNTQSGVAKPGGHLRYGLAVADAGPSDAAGPVTVTDLLPPGETYVSAAGPGWSCASIGPPAAVTCTLPSERLISDTAAGVITLTVAIGAAAYPSVSDTATVDSPTPDPDLSNNASTDMTSVPPDDDLVIHETQSGPSVAGTNLTYSLAVTNNGPTPDPGPVTVTDQLATGETLVSAVGQGWICTAVGATVTCVLPDQLVVGAGSTIALVVALDATADPNIINTAVVEGAGTDPDLANNISRLASTIRPGALLSLTKTLNGTDLISGGQATYTVTVGNKGPSSATGVSVTDALPTGLKWASASGTGWDCTVTAALITCDATGAILDGATSSFTVVATVTATSGTIANEVIATAQTALLNTGAVTATTPPAPVEGAQAVVPNSAAPKGALPATGIDLRLYAGAGLAFEMLGFALLGVTRRFKPKPKRQP
jgi:uncharacterized repeat protein (TIGR01451 family)